MLFTLALAASLALDDGYDTCMETAVTNPDFAACGTQLLGRRDAELNRVWKAAIAYMDVPTKQAVLDEQRLWNAFKEKSCRYWMTGAFGSEGQTIHFYTCRAGVIDARIEYLGEIGSTGGPDQ